MYIFKQIEHSEFDSALAIVIENVKWLEFKGIKQWTEKYSREVYPKFQEKGENYGLFRGTYLQSVVSLVSKQPEHWNEELHGLEGRFLIRLAVRNELKGMGIGQLTVNEAKVFELNRNSSLLFLEASTYSEFLPKYYSSLGFEKIGRKEVTFESGTYDLQLMKCVL